MPVRKYATNADRQAAYRERKATLRPTQFWQVVRWESTGHNSDPYLRSVAMGDPYTSYDMAKGFKHGCLFALAGTSWEEYDQDCLYSPDGKLWIFAIESRWRHVCPDCEEFVWSDSPDSFDPHMHTAVCVLCGADMLSVDGACIPLTLEGLGVCAACEGRHTP